LILALLRALECNIDIRFFLTFCFASGLTYLEDKFYWFRERWFYNFPIDNNQFFSKDGIKYFILRDPRLISCNIPGGFPASGLPSEDIP